MASCLDHQFPYFQELTHMNTLLESLPIHQAGTKLHSVTDFDFLGLRVIQNQKSIYNF